MYNDVATELNHPQLTWEQVLNYSFLSDFNLLHEAWWDIQSELWAQPAGCLALDQYHKLLHAPKEIIWLNKEIHSLVTYIHEEMAYIQLKVAEAQHTDPLCNAPKLATGGSSQLPHSTGSRDNQVYNTCKYTLNSLALYHHLVGIPVNRLVISCWVI